MYKIIKNLGLDNTLNEIPVKPKFVNRIKNNVPLLKNFNDMADLLHLPTTKEGYKYLLVIVDLATDNFDIEPMKNNTSTTTLDAMKTIFNRKYVKKPFASIRTDNGSEFKKDFHQYLYDNNIVQRFALPYRHTQLANVETLNKQLGYIFNLYMNSIEEITGDRYNEWTDILDYVRTELNKSRGKTYTSEQIAKQPMPDESQIPIPKYKVGDLVNYALNYPRDALNKKQPTSAFRAGDYRWSLYPVKIVKIITMNDKPYNRYILEGLPNVSYSEYQLIPAHKNSQIPILKILEKQTKNKKHWYLVQFKNQLKKNAVWVNEDDLIEKGYEQDINDFNQK